MPDETTTPVMGRPPIVIDWDAFESLCQMHATKEEFAFFFKCDLDTINNKCHEKFGKTFSATFEELSVGGRMSLRRRLWQNAMGAKAEFDGTGNKVLEESKPHAATAIFLSKQKRERGGLDFSDKVNSVVDVGDGSFERMMGMGKSFCDRMEKEKSEE